MKVTVILVIASLAATLSDSTWPDSDSRCSSPASSTIGAAKCSSAASPTPYKMSPLVEVACSIKWRQLSNGHWDIDGTCFSTCGEDCDMFISLDGQLFCDGCGSPCVGIGFDEGVNPPDCDGVFCNCAVRLLDHSTWNVCTCP